jgi:CBS domain-containing protein
MTDTAGLPVSAYMHRQLEILPQDATALKAAERMRDQRIGSVFVEALDREQRDCRLAGIVTETDLISKVLAQGREADRTPVSEVMSQPLLTIAPDRLMIDASHLMQTHQVRHLGVSDGTEIAGVISVRDLAKYYMDATSGAVQALNDVYQPLTVLMQRAIETLDTRETVSTAARMMKEKRIGSVFVTEAGEIVGIVTESDVVRKALAGRLDPAKAPVGSLLNFPLVDVDINRSIRDACELMAKHHVRHLVVSQLQKIVGVISIRDLVKMVAARDRPEFLRRS